MATRQRAERHEERVVVLAPKPVDRLLALASAAMRPEMVTARCLDCILSEFRALKAVMH